MKTSDSEKPVSVGFYVELLSRIMQEEAVLQGISQRDVDRDINYLVTRSQAEGIRFLTETLPLLGKAFDKAISRDAEFVVPQAFQRFDYGTIQLPVFLQAYWKRIWTCSGSLKGTQRGCHAVRLCRTVCYMFYKLELPIEKEKEDAAWDKFIQIDANLPVGDVVYTPQCERAIDNARLILSFLLKHFDPLRITPRHGPGAVATKERRWEKFSFKRFFPSLDRVFGYPDYFFFNYGHLCDELENSEVNMEVVPVIRARATMVPKDSRGPRLISMEPLEAQWIQQGLARALMDRIEHPDSISSGYVNFTDQRINQYLALWGTYDRELITLDLSEASDRVPLWLVEQLFPTDLFGALCACRSEETTTPRGTVKLRKFATMGSACCFPVESLVFWAVAVAATIDTHLCSYRQLNKAVNKKVWVYGDDIVLRAEHLPAVSAVFDELGFVLNEDKCCTGLSFRESCGFHAYKGTNVTPLRVHSLWQEAKALSPQSLLSYVALHNAMQQGEWSLVETAEWLRSKLLRQYPHLPCTLREQAQGFALYIKGATFWEIIERLGALRCRFNRHHQALEVRTVIPYVPALEPEGVEGWILLQEWKAKGTVYDPFGFARKSKIGQYEVPHLVKMRWAWQDVTTFA